VAEDPVDVLYGLPLDQFVSERNRLAKEHKDPSLKKRKKPSVAAWSVNQLARSHADALRALVDAAAAVRAAQQRAVSGARTGGADLRGATRAHRAAVDALVDALPSGTTATVVERVRATLASASLDESLLDDLVAGRLTDDVEPAGFGDLTGLEVLTFDDEDEADAEQTEPDPHADERAAVGRELDDAREALRAARQREADARAEMDRAYDAVRDAERAVADLESRLGALGGG
jgi:hypothetical protein